MSNDKMRDEFEAWVAERAANTSTGFYPQLIRRSVLDDGVYMISWVDSAWEGWQASREALVIELPSYECFGQYSEEAARVMRDGCADAIEETGEKWVKL